ncbi:Fatty acid synthase [Papilio xuthus]|uniref:Fatty acid synthase n=1 Tax=Papilio xuthus TaxID=66420 RepID=A0A194PKD7_PAPXU|nr:Fatty acid synthase [Papilio xuthus]
MVPTPQELNAAPQGVGDGEKSGDRVVISGMSGLFPNSYHVKDLAEVLYSKRDPISSKPRWQYNHPEVAPFTGKVPDIEYFDAQFFKVHFRLGHTMDPMARKLLEQAYQAIYDAGVSPEHLSGRKVGVFIGTCFSETEKACFYVASTRNGFGIAGCNKSMFANRISYWLNAKGPSMSIDESCCSSIAALEQAYLALSRGDCEAAIVGGGNVCLHPQSSLHYGRIMSLSMDGKTKSFDEKASGCAKSEAINVLFLQKAKDALRIYADVVHVKSEFLQILNNETGPRYGFYRNPRDVAVFLNNFYKEARVPPQAVEYVEASGSAIPEADKAELETIDAVFCKDRAKELYVGSVMSNIGYGEAASGISAVTKVLLGYHTGELAANLNCDTPRKDVAALREGRIRIVTEHQPFNRSYVAVNGISITGVNAHVLLHGHYKPKDVNRYKSNIPHLVTLSARQDSSVKRILSDLKSRPIDPEELALFHNIHETRISGHLGRGFTILSTDAEGETVSLCEKVDYFDDVRRPLWFVYSGMGSQWPGMGTQLMRIPIFAAAIERCHRVLEPLGVNIVDIITNPDKTAFDNILHSFVGIAAVQIGLTDVLRAVGLVPDKIIGHSVGELGCAYADGCFTAEEMILAAYYRGLVSVQTPFIRGSMAAVGIGYKQVIKLCPPEIEVACHNGPESCTISGPADAMKEFVAQLTEKSIFAKEVPCSNIAYHSRYIAKAGPGLLKYLSQVIKSPKRRSEKWMSTSVPQERWNEPIAQYSSAEYHTNNLLNSVLFEETSKLIPANAVLVEIAPHGLLQAILKRSLPETCRHVPLTRRGHPDNVQFLLEAVGKLYMEGYNPKVAVLYPKIEFPVSTGTPMLSHLVEWAHHEKWNIPTYVSAHRIVAASCKSVYSVYDVENEYLTGNVIRGKNTFPFTAALVAVWDLLAMSLGMQKKQLSVQYKDIKLYCQPMLHKQRQLRLFSTLHRGTGYFEIMDEHNRVATGFIKGEIDDDERPENEFISSEELDLKSEDIYEILKKRGFDYSGEFQSIRKTNKSLTEAQIIWNNNWVTFIDGILQLYVLARSNDSISLPTHIRKMIIDIKKHSETQVDNDNVMTAQVCDILKFTRCGGVIIEDLKFRDLPPLTKEANLMALKIVPYFQQNTTDFSTGMLVLLQIVAENLNKTNINIVELCDNDEESSFENLTDVLKMIPAINIQHKIVNRKNVLEERVHFLTDVDILLVTDLSKDDKLCQTLYRVLCRDNFIVNKESVAKESPLNRPSALYRVVSAQNITNSRLELVRWRPTTTTASTSAFTVRSASDLALLVSSQATLPQRHKLLIITSYPPIDGLKELVQKWRKDRNQIYVVMINHKFAEDQNIDQLPNLDLVFNVLDNGRWCGEFTVPIEQTLTTAHNVTLQSSRIGDFNSLQWVEMPNIKGPGVKVTVHYAGINNTDVKRCLGIIPNVGNENCFGMDFSGVTESGERVMGVLPSGAISSQVLADPNLLWPVPEHWTLEEAATVPLAYSFALYCIGIKVLLNSNMTVLVHGGAGALGQAVISIALANGCNVFTTVSDIGKKRFLCKMFPQLKENQIGNSRDHTFADMVLAATNGEGCHVTISCVAGSLKNATLNCLGLCGIHFDTIQITTRANFSYGMFNLTKERSYMAVDFAHALREGNLSEISNLQLMLAEGIKRGYVRPLSRVVYSPSEVPRAFRLLAESRHRGRVLIQLQGHQDALTLKTEPRLNCSPDLSHLIMCNNNYFGLRIAERLVLRGARKIYLHSLKPSGRLDFEIRSLEQQGVKVVLSNEVLNTSSDLNSLLANCTNLSTIESVYVVAVDKYEEQFNLIQELDMATRKLSPALRYFAVINGAKDYGVQSCLSRVQERLPATLIKIPSLNKMDKQGLKSEEELTEIDAVNVFERSLRSNEAVLIANTRAMQPRSLLEQIASLAGIEIPKDVAEEATLSDLDFDHDKSANVTTYLRDVHNISLIREIEESMRDIEFEETKGLATFYSDVDTDELQVTTEMVFLPTLASNSAMRDDEFDATQTYLCIIPGLEGNRERFRLLCERIKLPAVILQPGLDRPDETVSDLAKRYAETLLKKTALKRNFYLLGYESGILVALEIAAILEDHGLTGTVFCIGASPDELQVNIAEQLKEYDTDEALRMAVARHMFSLMVGGSTDGFEKAITGAFTWKEKIEACARSIIGKVSHSAQYTKEMIDCAYKRIKQIQEHKPTPRTLRSKIILLRAATVGNNDQSLQNYSKQPITVYELSAPLAHSAKDLRCSSIINNHLDAELLEEFEKKNLCDTYLLNADTFMTTSNEN